MDRTSYEGFVIEQVPDQLVAGGWTVNLFIENHQGNHIDVRQFSAANTFPTREEAALHCVIFGQQIIDGKVPSCSPP